MYSSQYFYFNLRPDKELSKEVSIEVVKNIFGNLQEIEEIDLVSYKNNKDYPWISVDLIKAKSSDNWNSDKDIKEVNLISIVGTKNAFTDSDNVESMRNYYLTLLKKISNILKWEIVEEETEEGIENLIVYNPTK